MFFNEKDHGYRLEGAIGLGSRTWPLQFTAFLKEKHKWYHFENDIKKAIKKSTLHKMCAFVLFYRRNVDSFIDR